MPFFSKVFRSNKDAAPKTKTAQNGAPKPDPPKPRWSDAWFRTEVEPEEIQELVRGCTQEIKARALDVPFLLLPFRPASDPSAAKTFVRNYFGNGLEAPMGMQGGSLVQELKLVEPMVLCSVLKWCWSRLAGGVVTWEAYELFQIGEQDSNQARDAFSTFIPISVGSDARAKIIADFFDLLAAIAAHGKVNGLAGRKLSRFAGWWAFEHGDTGSGFDGGYKNWSRAADATSHLFFAYLRSLTPELSEAVSGISTLPRSLQALLYNTEYPPVPQTKLQARTSKVVMVVETVSPTPFALLRRAKNFQYRDDDVVLQKFSDFDDPVAALTDECRRVLLSISSANDLSSTKTSTSLKDPSWSRFEDIGFSWSGEDGDGDTRRDGAEAFGYHHHQPQGLRTTPMSKSLNRPTTPSWADFLSSGFVDEKQQQPTFLLPPDKVLPPIDLDVRGHSSQSHRRPPALEEDSKLEPGELANIASFNLDDAFWWVWITSLAGEEPPARKAVFGRCALIETRIERAWLLMEEIMKGAAPEPEMGTYVAEKKSRFGFSRRTKVSRSKSTRVPTPQTDPIGRSNESTMPSKTSIAPDQRSRIQAAAAALQEKQKQETLPTSPRRGRHGEDATKTNSTMTLQPAVVKEAAPAMKWASSYDKNAIRKQYLGNTAAGRGSAVDLKEFLGGSGADSRNTATPTPGAAPARSDAATPTAEKPNSPEPTNAGTAELTQSPSKEQPKQNGEATSSQPGGVLAPQPPMAARTSSLEASTKPVAPQTRKENVPPADKANASNAAVVAKTAAPSQQKSGVSRPEPSLPPKTPDQSDSVAPASSSSPESPRNKLKKKNQQTGLKGMFNRKKDEQQKKPAPTSSPSSSSVAAARAALEAKAKQSHAASPPPATKVTSKRFSAVGSKGPVEESASGSAVPAAAAAVAAEAAPASSAPRVAAEPAAEPTRESPSQKIRIQPTQAAMQGQRFEIQQQAVEPSEPRVSSLAESTHAPIDVKQEQQANQAFKSFDQGPLDENPYNLENSPAPSTPQEGVSEAQKVSAPESESAPAEQEDLSTQATDRWAQIRKNAAERAARMSEEQSGVTDKTDDGETSGEETIEARVARIKARVAELTGNMETNGSKA